MEPTETPGKVVILREAVKRKHEFKVLTYPEEHGRKPYVQPGSYNGRVSFVAFGPDPHNPRIGYEYSITITADVLLDLMSQITPQAIEEESQSGEKLERLSRVHENLSAAVTKALRAASITEQSQEITAKRKGKAG